MLEDVLYCSLDIWKKWVNMLKTVFSVVKMSWAVHRHGQRHWTARIKCSLLLLLLFIHIQENFLYYQSYIKFNEKAVLETVLKRKQQSWLTNCKYWWSHNSCDLLKKLSRQEIHNSFTLTWNIWNTVLQWSFLFAYRRGFPQGT